MSNRKARTPRPTKQQTPPSTPVDDSLGIGEDDLMAGIEGDILGADMESMLDRLSDDADEPDNGGSVAQTNGQTSRGSSRGRSTVIDNPFERAISGRGYIYFKPMTLVLPDGQKANFRHSQAPSVWDGKAQLHTRLQRIVPTPGGGERISRSTWILKDGTLLRPQRDQEGVVLVPKGSFKLKKLPITEYEKKYEVGVGYGSETRIEKVKGQTLTFSDKVQVVSTQFLGLLQLTFEGEKGSTKTDLVVYQSGGWNTTNNRRTYERKVGRWLAELKAAYAQVTHFRQLAGVGGGEDFQAELDTAEFEYNDKVRTGRPRSTADLYFVKPAIVKAMAEGRIQTRFMLHLKKA